MARSVAVVVSAIFIGTLGVARAAQTPVPRPFPGTGAPPVTAKPQAPTPGAPPPATAAQPSQADAPTAPAALAGIPLFPRGEYLDSFDAGRGQRYYLYGARAPFEEVVAHFRTAFRTGGRQVYRTPAIQQFDLGRFNDDEMAFPPSVVVKDYAGEPGGGYLFVRDATEQRFPTIIQIVPPPAPARD